MKKLIPIVIIKGILIFLLILLCVLLTQTVYIAYQRKPTVYLYELTLKDNSKVQLYNGQEWKDYFTNGNQSIMKSEVKSFKKIVIKKDKEWFYENF